MAAEEECFRELLLCLLSPDNAVRQAAENALTRLSRETKMNNLLRVLRTAQQSPPECLVAAVILRRLFEEEFMNIYTELSQESRSQLLAIIMELIVKPDMSSNLRHKICAVASAAANELVDSNGCNQWPEMLNFIVQATSSNSEILVDSALRILENEPHIFGHLEKENLFSIKQMLAKNLDASMELPVRCQAARTISAFIKHHFMQDFPLVCAQFSDLLPGLIMLTAESVEKQDECSELELLIDLCESCVEFLRPQMQALFRMCLSFLCAENLNDDCRYMAVQLLILLSVHAPDTVRKQAAPQINDVITHLMRMLTNVGDRADWSTADMIENGDSDQVVMIAVDALDRIACSLGSNLVVPLVMNPVCEMRNSDNWKLRFAALMAISAVSEGCFEYLIERLSEWLTSVLQLLFDSHPRVRCAACSVIERLPNIYEICNECHEQVVPALVQLLNDVQYPCVQAHAAAAIGGFFDECPKPIVRQHVTGVMPMMEFIINSKLQTLNVKCSRMVLEQVIDTVATIAFKSSNHFILHFEPLVAALKYIVQNTLTDELCVLRGKAIKCVSFIGVAVGSEQFVGHAKDIMAILMKPQPEGGDVLADDSETWHLMRAWKFLCIILGKEFVPYLPQVMGPVRSTVFKKLEEPQCDNNVLFEGRPDFSISTIDLDNMTTACNMLICFADVLRGDFASYAEEVMRYMLALLSHVKSDLRAKAAESLPALLACAVASGAPYLNDMWLQVCRGLLNEILVELEGNNEDRSMLSALLQAIISSIGILKPECQSNESMEMILEIVTKCMEQYCKRNHRPLENEDDQEDNQEDSNDPDENSEMDESDVDILSDIVDIVEALIVANTVQLMAYVGVVIAQFVKLLQPQCAWWEQRDALYVLNLIIESYGSACAPYQHLFMPSLIRCFEDDETILRSLAANGCGLLAEHGGQECATTCAELVPILVQLVVDPNSRDNENIEATEDAILAITKILKFNRSALQNIDHYIEHWFSFLPITTNSTTASLVYGFMCDLIGANNPAILGVNKCNLPRILFIIAQSFADGTIESRSEDGARLLQIVRSIESNAAVFQTCLSFLMPELRVALQKAYMENFPVEFMES